MNKEAVISCAEEIADLIKYKYTDIDKHKRDEIYDLVYDVLMENGWNGYE